ncbi:MAG TPA: hypothetical protein VGR45_18810, partial [Stellaceae bacterium]|nr:hypothetical protein [Stellaceae bacterium]
MALLFLFAWYWSRQVCIRALPGDSLEYFDETPVGNTAFPAGAEVCLAAGAGCADVVDGEAAACVEVEPHSAFLKSFHFMPFSVPASCAALYLALHSLAVSAWADGAAMQANAPNKAMAHRVERVMPDAFPLTLIGRGGDQRSDIKDPEKTG